jgi:nicotinamide-nucleotide adenylyltransferase
MTITKYKFVVVHGRFQPFHNEHLAYIKWAQNWGEHLFIGITNFNRLDIKIEPKSQHRHTLLANPFTFWERALMIKDALLDEGFASSDFTIVPLPIDTLEKWPEFIPTDPIDMVHAVRIFSEWEQEKVSRLEQAKYKVITNSCSFKLLSASEIRKQIANDEINSLKVPAAVKIWLKVFNSTNRINSLIDLQESAHIQV